MTTKNTNAAKAPKAIPANQVEIGGMLVPTDASMRKDGFDTLSARIRHLSSMGLKTADIRKVVLRENGEAPLYQHVRNVLNTPLKSQATPVEAPKVQETK